jgi:hypothetical protein
MANKITDPFAAYNIPPRPIADVPTAPPRFNPGATSPLDRVKRETAALFPHQIVVEQRRAESLPDSIRAGDHAPRYGDVPARPPFPERVAVPVNANPGPKAGGSKS